jgi:hypothetical protein
MRVLGHVGRGEEHVNVLGHVSRVVENTGRAVSAAPPSLIE